MAEWSEWRRQRRGSRRKWPRDFRFQIADFKIRIADYRTKADGRHTRTRDSTFSVGAMNHEESYEQIGASSRCGGDAGVWCVSHFEGTADASQAAAAGTTGAQSVWRRDRGGRCRRGAE